MTHTLIIVESPAKCKTIETYLGNKYKVIASFGHIRNLTGLDSIDIKNNFHTTYTVSNEVLKIKQIERIKQEITKCNEVILATDDDREGESIAWHICDLFQLPIDTTKRIIFHEITERAIKFAISHPTTINMKIVNAQQSRQILDMLVGYTISPILWSKISKKHNKSLSAGRCQSPALRLIYDNYLDIKKSPGTLVYKTTGFFTNLNLVFELNKQFSKKEDVFDFLNESKKSNFIYSVSNPKKTIKKNPEPLTTSSLQQLANNILHITPKETMRYAQQLYEGGYITYMRTDSKKYSKQFITEIKQFIIRKYDETYINQTIDHLGIGYNESDNESVIESDNESDNESVIESDINILPKPQEAHESIRPVNINMLVPILTECKIDLHPKAITLYTLIWKRTLESCMPSAQYSNINSTIDVYDNYKFQHKSEQIIFPGWKKVESNYDSISKSYQYLITIKQGTQMIAKKIESKFTMINLKSHYSEAYLVHLLEYNGIGRPSTFATLVDKIQERLYVEKQTITGNEIQDNDFYLDKNGLITSITNIRTFGNEHGKLVITSLGIVIIEFLIKHFDTFFNYEYTKSMECELDLIANDKKEWSSVCVNCYDELMFITKELRNEKKFAIFIDKEHSIIIGQYGPVIKKIDSDKNVTFLKTKPNLDMAYLAKCSTILLDDVIDSDCDIHIKSIGKYKGKDLFIKNGKYGIYAQWGTEMKSLKDLGHIQIDKIEYIEVLKFLEKDGVLDRTKPVGFIRDLTAKISIRSGKFGDYILYKKPRAKKPDFLKLHGFTDNYKTCDKLVLLRWIKQKYDVE